ncbi:MAG: nucleotidyl transferase AbiEii/AbiGii toxin family protein [Terriglobia bacterium]
MSQNSVVWNSHILGPDLLQTLAALEQASLLLPFYLGGGTGLALQLGHRRSQDLDFFAFHSFDPEALLFQLEQLGDLSVTARSAQTLHVEFRRAKVSFLGYSYRLLFTPQLFQGVQVADGRDIACMKISAIAGRGAKRDFVDLYSASHRYGLPHLLELFQTKFSEANYSTVHLLKSLTYFEDAEKDPLPDLLIPLAWNEIKAFFQREAPLLL